MTSDVDASGPGPEARLPLRPGLEGLHPYGAPQLDVPVLLNVNENPHSPSEEVVSDIAESVAKAATGLNRYPDREFAELRAELSEYLRIESGVRVPAEQIWAANGSNEVMLHLFQAYGGPGRTAISFDPTYSMYPEYARDTHTTWVTGRRSADFTLDPAHAADLIRRHHPALIVLTSPNNPTGTALPLETVVAVLDAARGSGPAGPDGGHTDSVVVVDEAYGEFRRAGVASALTLLHEHPHLTVSRTMSKAFGMAGLRLGYLAAAPALVEHLRVVRLPYHLSAVTQAAALAALRHREEFIAQVASLRQERDDLVEWLRARGHAVADSDANFVLFGMFEDRHAVWNGLLERGVLIRETGPAGWLRVSVGTPQEMAAFTAALQEVDPR
ncbi:histidinol-phosphate transaminase [Bogoriella caseilytica]|uniref:Histidinol-phosphate aminotransferase n=1 Tax=Bogoriella caseilytica TaxID=56055 RepID=A0A3N2BG43_9MICO|nr:histidinol-phosphate transaminase [Bogoriella caseilytica]ROR74190.1 histidinol phosphate aminotransferase [Bogoriella caseilytica]